MSHDLLATSYPVSHASDAREFVAFAKAMAGARTPLRKAFGLFVKLPLAVGLGRPRGCGATCRRPPDGPSTPLPMRPIGAVGRCCGARRARAVSAAARARYAAGRRARPPGPGLPAPRAGAPAGPGGRALRAVRAALRGRAAHARSRTRRWSGRTRWRRRCRSRGSPSRPGPGRRRGTGGRAPGRGSDLQPLEHDRRLPATRQPQPGPQGGVRGERRTPCSGSASSPRTRCATGARPPPWVPSSGCSTVSCRGTGCRCRSSLLNLDVPAARAAQAQPDRHRGARGAAEGPPVPAPVRRARLRTARTVRRHVQRPVGAEDGRRRRRLRAEPEAGLPAGPVRRAQPGHGQPPAAAPRDASSRRRSLNMLAAAWIQFQVHDWVNHAALPARRRRRRGAAAARHRRLAERARRAAGAVMRFAGNEAREAAAAARRSVRQPRLALVGRLRGLRRQRPDRRVLRELRERRRSCRLARTATCRADSERAWRSPASTRAGGWASARCTRCSRASTTRSATSCARDYPRWNDERIYQTARLIVSALIAKIHTVEWTPAILGHRGDRRRR